MSSSAPLPPPLSTQDASTPYIDPVLDQTTLFPTPVTLATSLVQDFYQWPVLLALLPPLLTLWYGGKVDEWSEMFMMIVVAFYLYGLIKSKCVGCPICRADWKVLIMTRIVPWDLYTTARIRHLQINRVAFAYSSAHADRDHPAEQVRRSAARKLWYLEWFYFIAVFASPLLGAMFLSTIRPHLRVYPQLITEFPMTLYVLTSYIRPLTHLTRMAKYQAALLQDEVNYPNLDMDRLKAQVALLESDMDGLKRQFMSTKEQVGLDVKHTLERRVEPHLKDLNKEVRKNVRQEQHFRDYSEDKFREMERRLQDYDSWMAQNRDLLDVLRQRSSRRWLPTTLLNTTSPNCADTALYGASTSTEGWFASLVHSVTGPRMTLTSLMLLPVNVALKMTTWWIPGSVKSLVLRTGSKLLSGSGGKKRAASIAQGHPSHRGPLPPPPSSSASAPGSPMAVSILASSRSASGFEAENAYRADSRDQTERSGARGMGGGARDAENKLRESASRLPSGRTVAGAAAGNASSRHAVVGPTLTAQKNTTAGRFDSSEGWSSALRDSNMGDASSWIPTRAPVAENDRAYHQNGSVVVDDGAFAQKSLKGSRGTRTVGAPALAMSKNGHGVESGRGSSGYAIRSAPLYTSSSSVNHGGRGRDGSGYANVDKSVGDEDDDFGDVDDDGHVGKVAVSNKNDWFSFFLSFPSPLSRLHSFLHSLFLAWIVYNGRILFHSTFDLIDMHTGGSLMTAMTNHHLHLRGPERQPGQDHPTEMPGRSCRPPRLGHRGRLRLAHNLDDQKIATPLFVRMTMKTLHLRLLAPANYLPRSFRDLW
jgi:hypothetical protein